MKIYILSSFEDSMKRDTGASVRIYNLAKGLCMLGNDVHLIIPKEETANGCVDGVIVHSVRGFWPNVVLKVLAKIVGVARSTSLYFFDFMFLVKISRLIRQSDVVQIEQQTVGGLLVPFIRKVLGRPVVIDCHDVFQALRLKNTGVLRRALETFTEKTAYNYADLILTVSQKEKRCLKYYGIRERRVEVIPNGVDIECFTDLPEISKVREKYDLEKSRIVIFVGNMEYSPNREAVELLSSMIAPKVLENIQNVKFLVVGRKPRETKLPNIVFTGVVDSVPKLLAISDVAVAPLLHGSGTRLKILEYLSCGLPVISTSIGVEGLEVTNGFNILIEDNMERFASKIVQLLKDQTLCNNLAEAARELATTKYDWKIASKKLDSSLRRRFQNAILSLPQNLADADYLSDL